jgi:uncharacterized membrane protein
LTGASGAGREAPSNVIGASGAGQVFFDAVLRPHRSLGPRGFIIVMALLATISFISGVVFVSIGAWPVFGFFGLDVALVYIAFRASYAQARAFETVTLTEEALLIRRVSAQGREQSFSLEPYWLRIEIDEPAEHGAPLTLTSKGQTLSLGSFLTPEERSDLARALRTAIANRNAAMIARPSP